MIGFHWTTETQGACPQCGQNIVCKRKQLRLFGIPIPMGSPSLSCGCSAGGAAMGQQPMGQQQMGQQQMGQQQMGQQQMGQQQMGQQQMSQPQPQQAQSYPCQQCQTPLQWVGEHQRWYCATCQQYL